MGGGDKRKRKKLLDINKLAFNADKIDSPQDLVNLHCKSVVSPKSFYLFKMKVSRARPGLKKVSRRRFIR